MRRNSVRLGVGFVFSSLIAGACFSEPKQGSVATPQSAEPAAVLPDVRQAQEVVLAVRNQLARGFGGTNLTLPGEQPAFKLGNRFDQVRITPPATTDILSFGGAPVALPKTRAEVSLPASADGAFRIRDQRSGVSVEVGLLGATPAVREDAQGYVVYRSGYTHGAHIVHRPTTQGTEDYVYFPEKLPDVPELKYEVALGEGVAGLRLVGRTIEFMDQGGAPRLRMNPPYAVDGEGRKLELKVAIEGCAYDSSPAAPWGRPTVNPGARHCTLLLSWDGSAKAPLVVDPAWSLTMAMNDLRFRATSVQISPFNSSQPVRILVAGGDPGNPALAYKTAEIYDEASGTWTPTGQMGNARTNHAIVYQGSGNILYVIGGRNPMAINSTEKYDISTGNWFGTGSLFTARWGHTATWAEGRILVAGGINTDETPLNSAEVYSGGNWSNAGEMAMPRKGHTAIFAPFLNRVWLIGGDNGQGPTNHIESCDPLMSKCNVLPTPPPMNGAHAYHVMANVETRLYVFGGLPKSQSVEMFTPGPGIAWQFLGDMKAKRTNFAISPITNLNGKLIVTGGLGLDGKPQSSAEFFDGVTGSWPAEPVVPDMLAPRAFHTSATLSDGRVIVMGGTLSVEEAEIIHCGSDEDCVEPGTYCSHKGSCTPKKDQGEECDQVLDCWDGGECSMCITGNCTDGFCCNEECTGNCQTCNGNGLIQVKGVCSPVIGMPVLNKNNDALPKRELCVAHPNCGGTCNGTGPDCTYLVGTVCGKECTDGLAKTLSCTDEGLCETAVIETPCKEYACAMDAPVCATTCTKELGCADKYVCDETTNRCVDPERICSMTSNKVVSTLDSSMQLEDCELYACRGNACLTVCETAYDCVQPDNLKDGEVVVCDESRKCAVVTFPDTVGEATGCATSPGSHSARYGWLVALAAAAAMARRNRARA